MPTIEHHFTTTVIGQVARPHLPVELKNLKSGKPFKTHALVDTGADFCAFPKAFADILGIPLDDQGMDLVNTAGGGAASFNSMVGLRIVLPSIDVTFPALEVRFMTGLNTPLIGVRDMLEYFTLEVDYQNTLFRLHPNKASSALTFTETQTEFVLDSA